MIALEALV
jgi:hypothetical protein